MYVNAPITSMKVDGDDSEPTNPLLMSELVGGESSVLNTPVIEKKEEMN